MRNVKELKLTVIQFWNYMILIGGFGHNLSVSSILLFQLWKKDMVL